MNITETGMPREFQVAEAMDHRPQLHFWGEAVLTFSPTVTRPKKKETYYEQKGTGQLLRVKSSGPCLSFTNYSFKIFHFGLCFN